MADKTRLLAVAGWAISIAITGYMLSDIRFDLAQSPLAIAGNAGLGIPAELVLPIGIMGLICTLAYALPQTAMLGAILLSGFLGGAVMSHLRVNGAAWDIGENGLIGVLAWAGLWLRDERLRMILPIRRL